MRESGNSKRIEWEAKTSHYIKKYLFMSLCMYMDISQCVCPGRTWLKLGLEFADGVVVS